MKPPPNRRFGGNLHWEGFQSPSNWLHKSPLPSAFCLLEALTNGQGRVSLDFSLNFLVNFSHNGKSVGTYIKGLRNAQMHFPGRILLTLRQICRERGLAGIATVLGRLFHEEKSRLSCLYYLAHVPENSGQHHQSNSYPELL